MDNDTKQCNRCKEYKPLSEFYFHNGKPKNPCKACRSEYSKTPECKTKQKEYRKKSRSTPEYREKNRLRQRTPEHREYMRNYMATYQKTTKGKEVTALATIKHLDRKRKLPNTFKGKDWEYAVRYWGNHCAYCTVGSKNLHKEHFIPVSMDICPGTVPHNILPACQSCNSQKSDIDPIVWLVARFGIERAYRILANILQFFSTIMPEP